MKKIGALLTLLALVGTAVIFLWVLYISAAPTARVIVAVLWLLITTLLHVLALARVDRPRLGLFLLVNGIAGLAALTFLWFKFNTPFSGPILFGLISFLVLIPGRLFPFPPSDGKGYDVTLDYHGL